MIVAGALLSCESPHGAGPGAERVHDEQSADAPSSSHPPKHLTYEDLLRASEDDLAGIDIAEMNLAVAEGLPGAEDLDIGASLRMLNAWTHAVRTETERNLHRFHEQPSQYNDSLPYFKILLMVTVLQQDFGVRYNMDLVNSGVMADVTSTKFFRDSRDLFLNGFLSTKRSGSCASMPVLMVAVGRRLGYPLKLVATKGHQFARWEGEGERFNIETAGRGLNVYADSHYRAWPRRITGDEIATEGFLESSTPSATLADFLLTRAMCLTENGRYSEALRAYDRASKLRPKSVVLIRYRQRAAALVRVAAPQPAGVPDVAAYSPAPHDPALRSSRRLSPADEVRMINEFNRQNRPHFRYPGAGPTP